MLRKEGIRWTDGGHAVFDLQASTTEDLPDLDEVFCGLKVAAGSIAQIIQTGDFKTLDDNGTWY